MHREVKKPNCHAPDAFLKLKIHQYSHSAGAPPRTSLEELTTLPQTSESAEEGNTPPHSSPSRRLRRLDLDAFSASTLGASIDNTTTSFFYKLSTGEKGCHLGENPLATFLKANSPLIAYELLVA